MQEEWLMRRLGNQEIGTLRRLGNYPMELGNSAHGIPRLSAERQKGFPSGQGGLEGAGGRYCWMEGMLGIKKLKNLEI